MDFRASRISHPSRAPHPDRSVIPAHSQESGLTLVAVVSEKSRPLCQSAPYCLLFISGTGECRISRHVLLLEIRSCRNARYWAVLCSILVPLARLARSPTTPAWLPPLSPPPLPCPPPSPLPGRSDILSNTEHRSTVAREPGYRARARSVLCSLRYVFPS
jgi:hypothetical protein